MPGVKRYQDLDSYKLAVEVRREVLRFTRREDVRRDYRYLHQIRDSARGAPRNIAEGFSRFNPTEIVQSISYAKASLDETQSHLQDAAESGYCSTEDSRRIESLISRTIGALLRWIAYLESPAARRFYAQFKARQRATDFVSGTSEPKKPNREPLNREPEPRT